MQTSTCLDSETLVFDYLTSDLNLEPNGRDSMAADVFVAAIKRKKTLLVIDMKKFKWISQG